MTLMPATLDIAEAVRREAGRTPGLVAAYLFGSAARVGVEPRDVDVALVWSESVLPPERWTRGESLAARLEAEAALGGMSVDLVDLRRVSTIAPASRPQRGNPRLRG